MTSGLSTNRNLYGIGQTVNNIELNAPQISRDNVTIFARGLYILETYKDCLSNTGAELSAQATKAYENLSSASAVEELVPLMPSVASPKLEYFDMPTNSDKVFQQFRKYYNSNYIDGNEFVISTGCHNKCLMCSEDASNKFIKHIPYFRLLQIALLLTEPLSSTPTLLYGGNDVFQWRDKVFNADFGDLYRKISQYTTLARGTLTHGIWPKDVYANDAAKKIKGINRNKDFSLSFHLFHDDIFPDPTSDPNEKRLQKHLEKMANSISVLDPGNIRIMSDKSNKNKHLTPEFILDYFKESIEIANNTQHLCGMLIDENADNKIISHLNGSIEVTFSESIYEEGRAASSKYFDHYGKSNYNSIYKETDYPVPMISPFGELKIKSIEKNMPIATKHCEAKRIKEIYPDCNTKDFYLFMKKLKYALKDSKNDQTIQLWEKAFSFTFDKKDLVMKYIDKNKAEKVFRIIGELPVVTTGFALNRSIGDLNIDELRLYLFSLINPRTNSREVNYLKSINMWEKIINYLEKEDGSLTMIQKLFGNIQIYDYSTLKEHAQGLKVEITMEGLRLNTGLEKPR